MQNRTNNGVVEVNCSAPPMVPGSLLCEKASKRLVSACVWSWVLVALGLNLLVQDRLQDSIYRQEWTELLVAFSYEFCYEVTDMYSLITKLLAW